MPDGVYEVEITVTDAKNQSATKHLEYVATAGDPSSASEELVKAIVQQRGASRVKEIAADR